MKQKEIKNPAIKWLREHFCKHERKEEISRSYEYKYVIYVCKSCGKQIYSEL